jgi:hypothetical protein
MTPNFIRTVTINGKPLVLRFNKISDTEFEACCLNDKDIDTMTIIRETTQWEIHSGGNEEIMLQSARILGLMEDVAD